MTDVSRAPGIRVTKCDGFVIIPGVTSHLMGRTRPDPAEYLSLNMPDVPQAIGVLAPKFKECALCARGIRHSMRRVGPEPRDILQ